MIVVSDTTSISQLGKIRRLNLLPTLFERIFIPVEVWEELLQGAHPAKQMIQHASWLEIHPVNQPKEVVELQNSKHLGKGECAAIVLAREIGADLLLIDDLAARQATEQYGLPLSGTMGVLVRAKEQGILSAIKPILEELRSAGTYISDALYRATLRSVGEVL